MDLYERAVYDTFININQFNEAHKADLTVNPEAAANFAVIAGAIANLREHAAVKSLGVLERTTSRKTALRASIRQQMKDISRTTRALTLENTGLDKLFKIPDYNNAVGFIGAARGFAAEAKKFKADFIRYGLPADFIEDLTAGIAEFEETANETATAKGEGITATAAIDDEIERGTRAIKVLDAIIRNIYRQNPVKLANWTSARHVARPHRTIKTAPTAP